jgi:hypothetical protein
VLQGTDFAFGGNGQTDHSPEGHGTAMASLIAGHGHGPNGEDGIMGLAPGAKILPIGVGTGADSVGANYVAQAIRSGPWCPGRQHVPRYCGREPG